MILTPSYSMDLLPHDDQPHRKWPQVVRWVAGAGGGIAIVGRIVLEYFRGKVAASNANAAMNETVQQAMARIATLEGRADDAEAAQKRADAALAKAERERELIQAELDAARRAIQVLENQNGDQAAEVKALNERVAVLEKQLDAKSAEVVALQSQLREAKHERNDALQAEAAMKALLIAHNVPLDEIEKATAKKPVDAATAPASAQ